ncbi:RluA family pseudouridine synthase [Candidatus Dependentiae bacterium]|nr:RluA family pseudouridine synthase [Candidatus Dependentiae bacterium]
MPEKQEYEFVVDENAQRLDKFLAQKVPEYSRTYLQELIKDGHVTLNGKKNTSVKQELSSGDLVGLSLQPRPGFNLEPKKVDFEVVDVQADFIVINKPAGLLVHAPANRSQEITLVNGLLYMFAELTDLLKDDDRPGIVHRLDEDTSGLLLIARNERGKNKLGRMFHDRKISKTYKAVVSGHTPRSGRIDFAIGRHPTVRTKMSHQAVDGKPATSLFSVAEYLTGATLLDVKIITGRTHQIRVHCSSIGHGILGDLVYGVSSRFISRQALHAGLLEFEYDGVMYRYELPLPEDMRQLVAALGIVESVQEEN